MKQFTRAPAPSFWGKKEIEWLKSEHTGDPLDKEHHKKTLRHWFRENVRPPGEPALCVYCDGEFDTSPKTVDHFLPASRFPHLALRWWNLFPACAKCQGYKLARLPFGALCPEWPIEALFTFDPVSGELWPNPMLREVVSDRVEASIELFGLNDVDRCRARRRTYKYCLKGWVESIGGGSADFDEIHREGPYRFIADQMTPMSTLALPPWAASSLPEPEGDGVSLVASAGEEQREALARLWLLAVL